MIAGLSIGQYLRDEKRISTTKQFVTNHKLLNNIRHDQFAALQQKEGRRSAPLL
jgi:hypothetical protein